jgi:DNA polymerase III subunit epsilon
MREIVFDTETTGFDAGAGDRIVELGCVELFNHLPTGRTFQRYVNPGRAMSAGASRITGITDQMLQGKPAFSHASVVDDLLDFFADDPIIAHNAEFDRGFLNSELERLRRPVFPKSRFIDTMLLAKEHRPGAPASLDAVCKRFSVSIEGRALHGALLDAELTAKVYLELRGGRERTFQFNEKAAAQSNSKKELIFTKARPRPLPSLIDPLEAEAHAAFVETLGPEAVWKKH